DSTANPLTRESRSWCARWEGIGFPTTNRLREGSNASSATVSFQGPTGLADGLEVGSPLSAFARWRQRNSPLRRQSPRWIPRTAHLSGFRPSVTIVPAATPDNSVL